MTRAICVSLAVLSALGSAARGVDLGLCLCAEARAEAIDTCCPSEMPTPPALVAWAMPAVEGLEQGYCVEVRFTGVETMTDSNRVSMRSEPPVPPVSVVALVSLPHGALIVPGPLVPIALSPQATLVPLRI